MSTTEHTTARRDDTITIATAVNVSSVATVTDHAVVGPDALVVGRSTLTDHARLLDRARIDDEAVVRDRAVLGGTAMAYGSALVERAELTGTANVSEGAYLHGLVRIAAGVYDLTADIAEPIHHLALGPIGSEHRVASFFRAYSPRRQHWVGIIAAGCFRGTPDALERRITNKHAWDYDYPADRLARWTAEYKALIAMARHREASWEPITGAEMEFWEARLSRTGPLSYLRGRLDDYGIS